VLHCGDANCQSGNSIQVVGSYRSPTSIALDNRCFPIITFYSYSYVDALGIAHCGDANCQSNNTLQTIDGEGRGGDVGSHASLVLDTNGFPVVSYVDDANDNLKVVHCGDVNCRNGTSIETVDSSGTGGWRPSMAFDANGFPVITYLDAGQNGTLKVLHCGDANCQSGNLIKTLDSGMREDVHFPCPGLKMATTMIQREGS
jgi:hypothetical protein